MATIWFEDFDPLKHRNPMSSEVGTPASIGWHFRSRTIEPHRVTFVRVGGFTFEFHSVEQIQACLHYYQQKTLPSGRISSRQLGGGDHWEIQRWYERVPGELRRDSKRLKVVRAGQAAPGRAQDEPHLRADALGRDKDARARRSMGVARCAVEAYEAYLARFGDEAESYEVHSQYADLLYDLASWKEAGREYRRVVELRPRGDRSEHAAYQRVVTAHNVFDCGAFEDRTTAPIPLPVCARERLSAYEMYLQYFGTGSAAFNIRYRRAVLLQYYKRSLEAADAFAELVLTNDNEELAAFAAVRLLEVLTESGRGDEAHRWAYALKGMPRLVGHVEVRAAVAEALGEPKPSRSPQSAPLPPPDVVPGAPSEPLFLPDDSDSINPGCSLGAAQPGVAPVEASPRRGGRLLGPRA
jgi:hypothetical protein